MIACPNCNAIAMFMAYKDGILLKVLEDHEDVAGIQDVHELLCVECNEWFPNPLMGDAARTRVLTGELVSITGLKGRGTIKVVATGVKMRFHYTSYQEDAAGLLKKQSVQFVKDLFEFAHHGDVTLGLRVKAQDNPNTWVYRLDKKRLQRDLQT